MTHDSEWSQVRVGSQVWVNQYTWIVEQHAGTAVTLYSPALDKRHHGSPKPFVKVPVLTPDDKRYIKDWSEKFLDVTSELDEEQGALYREMLLVVKLGGLMLGDRRDGEPWWCPPVEREGSPDQGRLHLIYFHRIEMSHFDDDEIHEIHAADHTDRGDDVSTPHTHGGRPR